MQASALSNEKNLTRGVWVAFLWLGDGMLLVPGLLKAQSSREALRYY